MNEKRNPNQRQQGGLNLSDIYYVLFRHKWLIIAFASLGFIGAGVIYVMRPTVYTSQATIMLRSVTDNHGIITPDGEHQQFLNSPEALISGEMAILSSFDLALRVATNVGPARILAKYGGGDNMTSAAGVVHQNLNVERDGKSTVLVITLSHRDENMVQPILAAVVDSYRDMHLKVHVDSTAWEQLKEQTDHIHSDLLDTVKRLQDKLKAMGVSDIEAARKSKEETARVIQQQIFMTQWELEPHKVMLAQLKGASKSEPVPAVETNAVAEPKIPQEKLESYRRTTDLLTQLKDEYLKLRATFSEQSTLVKEKQAQIDKAEKTKAQMEKDEPRLAKETLVTPATGGQTSGNSTAEEIANEEAKVTALESKINLLQKESALINSDRTNLDAVAPDIHDLELQREIQETKWKMMETRAQNEKLDSDTQALKDAGIAVLQQPTPPGRESSRTPKLMGMLAAAGVLGGLALAFALEMYIDHSVKRPKEIEGDLGLRLFLSIPDFRRNGHRRFKFMGMRKKAAALENGDHAANGANGNGALQPAVNGNGNGKLQLAPWDPNHSMHQFNEALRDRLISYFDINHMTHKPKLVAVTGSAKGAGTSTIAAGLAASLSETGEGNVLLVDMNMEQGATQQFYMGKPGCELDMALEQGTRENALIQDKLYVVSGSTNGDKLSRMLPKRFANLVPKLKASDYDYIIFDMPPIARTGVTQRLAGFMDMMLLVVEAEKTSRDVVRQASALLNESKANVSVVLNKTRSYVPARLHQEF